MAALVLGATISAADGPPPSPTPAQRKKLEERERRFQELQSLRGRGEFDAAVTPAEAMLALEREALGDDSDDVSDSLIIRAEIEEERDRWDSARERRREILARETRRVGKDHWRVTDARWALDRIETALRLGKDGHDAFLNAIQFRTFLLFMKLNGRAEEGEPLAADVAEVMKAVLGGRHPDYAAALHNHADLEEDLGHYEAARAGYERALAIGVKALGERHPSYASGLNRLGKISMELDDHARARRLVERALEIRRATLGERNPAYATSLNDLGLVHKAQGDYVAALSLYKRALAIFADVLGELSPTYVINLNNLALLYMAMGEPDAAQPLLERAIRIYKARLGEAHPDYAKSLNNLAQLSRIRKDYKAARTLYERYLEIVGHTQGERHPAFAAGLNNLARLSLDEGDAETARRLFERALVTIRDVLGPRHSTSATPLYNLAVVSLVQGKPAEALEFTEAALALDDEVVARSLPALPEREQVALIQRRRAELSFYLSLPPPGGPDAGTAYRRWLASRGLVAESAARRSKGLTKPAVRALFDTLATLRVRLNSLYYQRVPAERIAAHARAIRELTENRIALEVELARAVGWKPDALTPEQVAAVLPEGSALVEFVRYGQFSPAQSGWLSRPAEPHYAAFVVRRGAPPRRVELGPEATIRRALGRWLQAIESVKRIDGRGLLPIDRANVRDDGSEVTRLVWKPLVPWLDDVKTVRIAPDGVLAFLPWGALPRLEGSGCLLEDRAFAVVASGRELVEIARAKAGAVPAAGSLLVVGGVDYLRYLDPELPRPDVPASRATAIRGLKSPSWEPLPGTLLEAQAVRRLFVGAGRQESKLLHGSAATKTRLAAELPGHRYLHLATHGFFAEGATKSALVPRDAGAPEPVFETLGRDEIEGFYPGLLSGLVWAGANDPPKDPVTGFPETGAVVMTAEEVSGLELLGCELAVLSACRTALGVAGGEGVQGLQQAFHTAGVRTVISSLWRVDDDATAFLMQQFYTNLWRRGLSKIEALRQAQLTVLSHPDRVMRRNERGAVNDRPAGKSSSPLPASGGAVEHRSPTAWWAAFLLSGDPG